MSPVTNTSRSTKLDNPRRAKPATMADVAAHAKVSPSTVSFVLSDNAEISISEDTRQRVFDAARELGYRRNAAARALASRRTSLLGVVSDVLSSPFGGDAVIGAQKEARKHDFHVLMAALEYDETLNKEPIQPLLDMQVEALVVMMTTHFAIDVPRDLDGIPTVLVNCFDPTGRVPSITPDEERAGQDATEYLISKGHRRIGLINLEPQRVAAIGRRTGYERALTEAGITPDPELIIEGSAQATGGYVGATKLLNLEHPPTAIFAATDRIAMGAYDAIKERGLRIPQDISVLGFDDQEIITHHLRPTLTTMKLPFKKMARRAVELLADNLDGNAAPLISERIICRLVERDSVAPPRESRLELASQV